MTIISCQLLNYNENNKYIHTAPSIKTEIIQKD